MTDRSILYQFEMLPENLKQEVLDFVGYLIKKYKVATTPGKGPVFGSSRGKYVMADNFDEPLEDFKDYM